MSSAIRQIPLDTATRHHSHDYHQIVIALAGRADFDIEGLGGTIEAFCGCIVPANHLHYYAGTGNNRKPHHRQPIGEAFGGGKRDRPGRRHRQRFQGPHR